MSTLSRGSDDFLRRRGLLPTVTRPAYTMHVSANPLRDRDVPEHKLRPEAREFNRTTEGPPIPEGQDVEF